VLLHFHEIYLPYEYPEELVIKRNWSWNEQYLLLAFLLSNDKQAPLVGNHMLLRSRGDALKEDLRKMDVGVLSGASFWVH
jgi:hypothetical protein